MNERRGVMADDVPVCHGPTCSTYLKQWLAVVLPQGFPVLGRGEDAVSHPP